MSLNAQLNTGRTPGRRALARLAVAFAVVVLVVAAVATWQDRTGRTSLTGSLDGSLLSGSTPSATVTMSQFLARADGLCDAANRRSDSVPRPHGDEQSLTVADLAGWASYLTSSTAIVAALVTQLRQLPQPAGLSPQFATLTALVDEAVRAARAARDDARRGDLEAFKRDITASNGYADQANEISLALGLAVCAG
jgi:hypothetical protein